MALDPTSRLVPTGINVSACSVGDTTVQPPRRRRTIWSLIGPIALVVTFLGCVVTVDGLIDESYATFDERLLGVWEDSSGNRATVQRSDSITYSIEYTSDGNVDWLEARLGLLGNRMILDVWPSPGTGSSSESLAGLYIGGHLVFAVDIGPGQVRLAPVEADSVIAAIDAGRVRLTYSEHQDQLVLHGTTTELRSELGPYLSHSNGLAESTVWTRTTPTRANATISPAKVPCYEASAWRLADLLFRQDPRWLGADGASSVDLGDGRTLWLFGDTWIEPSGSGVRRGAFMVRNSIGIQTDPDPTVSDITFYWGRTVDDVPTAFFVDPNADALWPGGGVLVHDRLIVFFNQIVNVPGGLGFESTGWRAMIVENPDAIPTDWRTRTLHTPANPLGIIVGFAAAFRDGEHVYALGSQDPVKSHPIFAARWPVEEIYRGDLLRPEWWAGNRLGWVPDSSSAPRWPLFENGASELTVHRDPVSRHFLATQNDGFGQADIVMRAAPTLTGPWSSTYMLYRPPEYYRPNTMIYAAKAHPQLTGADLVLTYATNTFSFADHLADSLIYYPRFVRLSKCI